MRALVTGCAGFIGSHLAERLIANGIEVRGVDCLTPFYDAALKERNLERLLGDPRFELVRLDLAEAPLEPVLEGVDVVYHLAGQPGVRQSFGDFGVYLRHNVEATQRLLEAATRDPVRSFVYASSSSVYGNPDRLPVDEATEPRPVSPYGMTKLAVEKLADVYHRNEGVPVVGLRYFTAYGPRQRPDMAFSRFLAAALDDEELVVLGDGSQIRDFSFVGDLVDGTIAAAGLGRPGHVYNLGGGRPMPLREVLGLIGDLVGRPVRVAHRPVARGDARHTAACCLAAARDLGFHPHVTVQQGIARQLEWLLGSRAAVSSAAALAA